jgi:hypothetical protein
MGSDWDLYRRLWWHLYQTRKAGTSINHRAAAFAGLDCMDDHCPCGASLRNTEDVL